MTFRVVANIWNDSPRCGCPSFDKWFESAVRAGNTAPPQLQRLLAGADVIEVSEEEADQIRDWATQIDGWAEAPDDDKPLLFQKAGDATFIA